MLNPIKIYNASQQAQIRWIKKHPFQYIALNVILLGMFIWYVEYSDRKEMREIKTTVDAEEATQQD
jgi:hypothetical protein